MQIINGPSLRRLIPAGALAAVLAFSYMAQAPTQASSAAGYGNNCGVKGDGFHDHGKVCPNRPFPGHGTGVLRILGISIAESESSANTSGHLNTKGRSQINVTASSTSEDADDSLGLVNGRGHGHG